MINNTPSLDLVEFIETQILPRYAAFDRAHNMEHVTRVIRSSLELSRITEPTSTWSIPLPPITT